jgi:capsular exopolysaccharide synthesis family protein
LITSANVGEGKTTTAANLAVTMAQQGLRVLLVDCDLRRPRLHALFGMSNDVGLADLLNRRAAMDDVIRETGVERLSLLTSGSAKSGSVGPSELLGGSEMGSFLDSVADDYEIVLLDTPPVLSAPDAAALAARVGATVLVVRAGTTGRALARDAVQQLGAVGANVIGAVLNDPDAKTAKYREYSYEYGYYANA